MDRFERRGCAPIPYHLLSGLGVYAFLLSAAVPTRCTSHVNPIISNSGATQNTDIGMLYRIRKFLKNSVRLAIFRSLSIPLCRSYLPRGCGQHPHPRLSVLPEPTNHQGLKEWLSHREGCPSAKAFIL